jgi:hypothetical protein
MAVLVASTLSLGRREFAKTLSPGGRLEPAHLELKKLTGPPEAVLAEACRLFGLAHDKRP